MHVHEGLRGVPESRIVGARGWRRGGGHGKGVFNEDRPQVRKMRSVLDTDGGDGCMAVWVFLRLLNKTLEDG